MSLKTPLLRGLLALSLTGAILTGTILTAQALAPAAPAPLDRLELALRDIAALAQQCIDEAPVAGAAWLLTSTPLDLPAQRKPRQTGCRRA